VRIPTSKRINGIDMAKKGFFMEDQFGFSGKEEEFNL
jgi:hypothetical protein